VLAEIVLSVRRFGGRLSGWLGSDVQQKKSLERQRFRHFVSVRLLPEAPVDELVASFLAFDQHPEVHSLELGSNRSNDWHSRRHDLAFFITFHSQIELEGFLMSPARAAFMEKLQAHVHEMFIFDMESGVVRQVTQ